MNNEDDDNEE